MPKKTTPNPAPMASISPTLGAALAMAGKFDSSKAVEVASLQNALEAAPGLNPKDIEARLELQAIVLEKMFFELVYAANNGNPQMKAPLTELALKAQRSCQQGLLALHSMRSPKPQPLPSLKQTLNQLLVIGGGTDAGKPLVGGKTATAAGSHPEMETVGAFDRATNPGRQGDLFGQ